jgi:hypothetical protein
MAPNSKIRKPSVKKESLAGKPKTSVPGIGKAAAVGPGETQKAATAARLDSKGVTNEERHQLIAEAAYFRAERRNFTPGGEMEDWLNAEAEVEMKLSKIGTARSPRNA